MKSKKVVVLPENLVTAVNKISLSKSDHSRGVYILSLIIRRKRMNDLNESEYWPFASTYWKKCTGSRYYKALRALLDNSIIEALPHSRDEGRCRQYRISADLMSGKPTVVSYAASSLKSDSSSECRSTVRFMRKLRLDVRGAKNTTDEYINSLKYRNKIQINPSLPDNQSIEVHPPNTGYIKPRHLSVRVWKQIAYTKGMVLIQDENEYYIDNPHNYFDRKERNILYYYYDVIYRFQHREFYATRNDRNNRLDSNLTSFPSILLKHLRFNKSSLVQLDLSNSQFTMINYLMKKGFFDKYLITYTPSCDTNDTKTGFDNPEESVIPTDFQRFMELTKNGMLYEEMQQVLGLPNGQLGRQQAKKMMFETCFSGKIQRGESKKKLREIFPTFVELSIRIKKQFGDTEFAVLLQLVEAYLFIDTIKKELDGHGFDSATRHDSIICPQDQAEEIEVAVQTILDRELGEYELKSEILD